MFPHNDVADPPEGIDLAGAFAWYVEHGVSDVVAVSERMLMADAVAAPVLNTHRHREIWQWAHDQSQAVVGWQPLPFLDGRRTRLLLTLLTGTGAIDGAVIHLCQSAPAPPAPPSGTCLETLFPGVSAEAKAVRARLADLLGRGLSLVLTGEPGIGKDLLAARLVEASLPRGAVRGVDPLVVRGEQATANEWWLGRLEDAVERRRPVVFHDIDRVPEYHVHLWLPALLRARRDKVPVVATRGLVTSEFSRRTWARALPDTLVLPPLRSRPQDVEAVAAAVLASAVGPRDAPKLPAATLRALSAAPWYGNVAELEAALLDAHRRGGGSRIETWALRLAVPCGDGTSSLAEAERRAVSEALERADGNKRAAAALLGISRSTLYRKLRLLGVGRR